MKDVFGHIMGTLPIKLVEQMPDNYPYLRQRWERRRGSTMPPSPLCDSYILTWEFKPYERQQQEDSHHYHLTFNVKFKWAPHTPKLFKVLKPEQVWHRSRTVAIAASPLQINEMDQRINQVRENQAEYHKYGLKERESHEGAMIVLERTKEFQHLNWAHLNDYIRERFKSSLGGSGFKWRDALLLDRSHWREIYNQVQANLEELHKYPTRYVANEPQIGMRSRTTTFLKSLLANMITETFDLQDQEIDRCRNVMFGNYMSMYTAFIPNKAAWYQKVLSEFIDMLHPAGTYYFPYVEGGHIYRIFSDLHREKGPFHAMDGKKWDASTGSILGKYFNCLMLPVAGHTEVPSGSSHTSMDDTLGMIAAARNIDSIKVTLGDDLNVFGKQIPHTKIIEESPDDTKFRYCLGLKFDTDPEVPRTTGLRGSADKAHAMIQLSMEDFTQHTLQVGSKHNELIRKLHAQMFMGQFGHGTLLERIEKVSPNDFKAPRDILDSLVEAKEKDILDWAKHTKLETIIEQVVIA